MMKQNNIYRVILSIAKNLNTITLLSAAVWAITSCTDEELAQVSVGKAGQLHIASVNVGDNKVASRADEGESDGTTTVTPGYNEVVKEVSTVYLSYSFEEDAQNYKKATAQKSDGVWSISTDDDAPLKPATGEKWEYLQIEATNVDGEGYTEDMPTDMGIASLSGDVSMRIYQDKLFASSEKEGGITVTTDLTSAQLGEMSITLKHVHALLHLPKSLPTTTTADDASGQSSPYTVKGGTYVKNGVAYQIAEENPLLTLWAELEKETETIYVPLTLNATDNVLQAIAPADYTLKAFKAVLDVEGDDNNHFVLDLPIEETNVQLVANTQYNLNLTLTPREQNVELQRTDKPGWGDSDVTLQGSTGPSLKYEGSKFVVSSAQGLQELNQWMTETGGENVKYIEGYGDIDQTVSRLSHDIHIDGKIDLSKDNLIYDLDGDDGTNGSNWKPLGTNETPYTGTITAAENAEITGLEIHVNTNYGGFVGYLGENGNIDGLKLQGNFSVTNASNFGAVVGYNDKGTISGCVVGVKEPSVATPQTTVKGTIKDGKSYSYIGGVVGWNNTGLIEKCINYATVDAPDYKMVGGVLGENHRLDNCVIKDCENYGDVTGYQHVGGVVGINHRVVNNCHNEGAVNGKIHVGGVIGMSNDASPKPDSGGKPGWPIYVINATNVGTVTGELCVGGVVGSNGSAGSNPTSGGYIVASWNKGTISYPTGGTSTTVAGTYSAFGGVVGVNYHTSRDDESTWTDEDKARKGNRTSHVIACYNTGSITTTGAADAKVGGVVGRNEANSKVWASYWNVSDINQGCGEELNTDTENVGKEYSEVTDWTEAITAMNEAIKKYIADKGMNLGCTYGIVESPSDFENITTTVRKYEEGAGTGAPQLSETAAGN